MVDTHLHVFRHGMPFADAAWARPDYEFTVEQCLAMLDRHGVGFAVIAAASIFGDYNDYTRWAVRTHPRLRGTVIVEPGIGWDVLEAMKRDGVVGVRLQWYERPEIPDLGSYGYRVLLERIRELDWHVHVNVKCDRLPHMLDHLRPSGVKIVVDHFGHPQEGGVTGRGFQETLAAVAEGRTWVKLSGAYRFGQPPEQIAAYVDALAAVDRTRLFWASDCPFVGMEKDVEYDRLIEDLQRWAPDPELRAQIERNALDFYFGGAVAP